MDGLANHNLFRACVDNFKISSNKPEHSRACLNTILRAAISNRRGRFFYVVQDGIGSQAKHSQKGMESSAPPAAAQHRWPSLKRHLSTQTVVPSASTASTVERARTCPCCEAFRTLQSLISTVGIRHGVRGWNT